MFNKLALCTTLILASSPALADFNGFYVGINAGSATGESAYAYQYPGDGTFTHDLEGAFYGGYAGYNYQSGAIVYGAEINFNAATGTGVDAIYGAVGSFDEETIIETLASLRARVGYTTSNMLVYAAAGIAQAEGQFTQYDFGLSSPDGRYEGAWDGSVIAVGAEYMIPDTAWVVRGEYAMYDLSAETGQYWSGECFSCRDDVEKSLTINTVSVGVSYQF